MNNQNALIQQILVDRKAPATQYLIHLHFGFLAGFLHRSFCVCSFSGEVRQNWMSAEHLRGTIYWKLGF
jgi:hypothetical protein